MGRSGRLPNEQPAAAASAKENDHEADLSAEQACPEAPSWLSRAHGDGRRPQGDRGPPRPRPQAPVGLSSAGAVSGGAPTSSVEHVNGPRRLRRRPDFLEAARGRRFHTDRLTAQGRLRQAGETRDGAPAEGLYLGFTITKRVGHATERNRIRRRLRSAAVLAATETSDRPADVVIVARRPCLDAPFETLVAEMRRALSVVTKPRGPTSRGDKPARPPTASGVRAGETAHVAGPTGSGDDRADTTPERAGSRAPHGSSDG